MNGTTLMLYPSLFISLFLSNKYAVVDKKAVFYPVQRKILDKTEENKLYIQKPEVEFLTFGFIRFLA